MKENNNYDNKSFIDKIKSAIKSDGVFLELQVLQELENRTFDVQLSVYYEDSVTNKLREIDVIADFRDSTTNFGKEVVVKFVIECKHIFKPWTILTSQYLSEDDELKYLALNSKITSNLSAEPFIDEIRSSFKYKDSTNLLFGSKNVGYALKQVDFVTSSRGKDVPFEAINGLTSAVKYVKQEADKSGNYIFIVPIIIFSGNNLYKAHVNEDNDLEIDEVKYGTILHQANVIDFNAIRINVVNFKHFNDFINEMQLGIEEIVYEIVDLGNSKSDEGK